MTKMFYFLALAVCCANGITVQDHADRIAAGNVANDTQFPYAISLQQIALLPNQTQAHRCGGAMITLQHALTTAMCTYNLDLFNGTLHFINATQYRVYAGGALLSDDNNPERVRTIANYTVHPDHLIFPALLNDIAIITLTVPYLNTTVVPIPIATNDFIPDDFTLCTLSGWGAQTSLAPASNELRYTTKYIYNHPLCTTIFNSVTGFLNIHPSMICAVSYDIYSAGCPGDEGNALVCNGELTGILSWPTSQCTVTSYPEIYTRVSNYTTWIRSITGGASTFKPELVLFTLLAIVCAKMFC